MFSREFLLKHYLNRPKQGHKGSFGTVIVVAGSDSMMGAALFSCLAAYRSGVAKVHLVTVQQNDHSLALQYPDIMLSDFFDKTSFELEFRQLVQNSHCTVLAIGPGLGRSDFVTDHVHYCLKIAKEFNLAVVLDADAIVCSNQMLLKSLKKDSIIMTPHPGEFKQFFSELSQYYRDDDASRAHIAKEAALRIGQVLLLKGYHTVVTNSEFVYVNDSGNSAMAVGGMGDVLTGCIAAIVAQGFSVLEAGVLGSYIHGVAGDLAEKDLGISLMASDMLLYLPKALKFLKTNI